MFVGWSLLSVQVKFSAKSGTHIFNVWAAVLTTVNVVLKFRDNYSSMNNLCSSYDLMLQQCSMLTMCRIAMDCRYNPTHVHYMKTSDGVLKCQHASIMAVTKWKCERDIYPSAEFENVMIVTANKRSVWRIQKEYFSNPVKFFQVIESIRWKKGSCLCFRS